MTASRFDTVSYLNLQVAKRCCEIGDRDAIFKPCKKTRSQDVFLFLDLSRSLWVGKMKDSGNELVKTGEVVGRMGARGRHMLYVTRCNPVSFVSASRLRPIFSVNGLYLSDFNKLLGFLVDPITCNCLS